MARGFFGLEYLLYNFLYSCMQGILVLTDKVYEIILVLCGINPNQNETEEASGSSLLESLLHNESIKMVFKWIVILSICIMAIIVVIALIRAAISRKIDDPTTAQKGIVSRTISSLIIMVLIPVFFFTFTHIVNQITQYVLNAMQVLNPDILPSNGIASNILNAAISGQFDDIRGPFDHIPDIGEFNKLQFDTSMWDVNYIIGIFGGAMVLFAMCMLGFKLGERIFMLIFYFLIGPFVLSLSPLDDGTRFNTWKDSVIAKLLASGGIIICINLYMMVFPMVAGISKTLFAGNVLVEQIFNILFLITGAFFASRGGEIIANLVGDNIGANEGRDTADSFRKAMGGMKLAGATMLGAGALASKPFFGSKASRSRGFANSLGNKIKDGMPTKSNGDDNDDSGKASKHSKWSKVWSGIKDNTQNFRRYGAVGGLGATGRYIGENIYNVKKVNKAVQAAKEAKAKADAEAEKANKEQKDI